jgi:hypothetical protein
VTNWTFVADMRDSQTVSSVPMTFGTTVVRLGTPVGVGKLIPVDGQGHDITIGNDGNPTSPPAAFRIVDGMLAGRVPADSVLAGLGSVKLPADAGGNYVCNNQLLYQLAKSYICSASDVMNEAQDDLQDRPCNALSTTAPFEGVPAKIGADYAPPLPEAGCGPGWTDTCN